MKYTRIYADRNGESHFEDVEISMKPGPANAGTISEMIAAKGVMFRQSGEYFINWHNAPRRQFVVTSPARSKSSPAMEKRDASGPAASCWRKTLPARGTPREG